MNLMEKLAASHMTKEGFAAWSGEQEKAAAGKVSKFLSAIKAKAKGAAERVGAIGGTKVPKSQMGKGMAARVRKDDIARGAKRLAIGGAGVAGAGALAVGAKAMSGKKKGYKERM